MNKVLHEVEVCVLIFLVNVSGWVLSLFVSSKLLVDHCGNGFIEGWGVFFEFGCVVLFGLCVKSNLEIGGWIVVGVQVRVAGLMNGRVKTIEILSNNVVVNVGDEKVGGFFGDLSVYGLVESVKFARG